jgi:hypothetical protein
MVEKRKDPAAVQLGRKGGLSRVKNQNSKERSESAKNAAVSRWDAWRAAKEEKAAPASPKPKSS